MPEVKDKPLTQQELMIQYLKDENLKIVDLDLDNHPENIHILEVRLAQFEGIIFEAKVRATPVSRKVREHQIKNFGEVKKITSKELKDPRLVKTQVKKIELSKLEKMIQGFVTLEYADKDILDMIPEKFTRGEVWKAIRLFRPDSTPILTEEQKIGLEEEKAQELKAKE